MCSLGQVSGLSITIFDPTYLTRPTLFQEDKAQVFYSGRRYFRGSRLRNGHDSANPSSPGRVCWGIDRLGALPLPLEEELSSSSLCRFGAAPWADVEADVEAVCLDGGISLPAQAVNFAVQSLSKRTQTSCISRLMSVRFAFSKAAAETSFT